MLRSLKLHRPILVLIGALVAASPAMTVTGTSSGKPLLMLISIDGMGPDAVIMGVSLRDADLSRLSLE
jgi:hypothetical protein